MSIFRDALFTTKRLRVFKATIIPDPRQGHLARDFFFAVRTDVDCPMVVCSATCLRLPAGSPFGKCVFVELIETSALHRRDGLATELWRALEKYYDPLAVDGQPATDDGEKFLASLEKETAA